MNPASARPSLTFSFLDILDRTFRIYRENFTTIVGFAALVIIPISVLNQIIFGPTLNSLAAAADRNTLNASTSSVLLSSILSLILQLVEFVLIYGVISTIASESLFGHKVSIGDAFNLTKSRFTQLGCGLIVFYIVIAGLAFAITLVAVACSPAIVGFALIVYIGIATFALVTPVLVLEDVGVTLGVNRAYGLGRSRFWTVVGVLATITIITSLLGLVIGAVIGVLGNPAIGRTNTGITLIQSIATVAVKVLTLPLLPIAMTLLYYDVRSRVEGLDLALAAVEKPNPRPADVVSPRPAALLTGHDLVNIVVLGVVVVVLSLVAGGLLVSIMNFILARIPTAAMIRTALILFACLIVGVGLCHADEIDERGFWQLLEQTEAALTQDLEHPVLLDGLLGQWAQIESVQVGNTPVKIDTYWIVRSLGTTDRSEHRQLLQYIQALLDYHATRTNYQAGSGTAAAALAQVLNDPRFQYQQQVVPTPLPTHAPERDTTIDTPTVSAPFSQLILIAAGVLLVAIVLMYAARLIGVQPAAIAPAADADPTSFDEAQQRAENFETNRDYRTAVRYLYLSSLLLLDEHDLIHYDASLTNREHLRQIAGKSPLAEALRPVVNTFEDVWYGFLPVDTAFYQQYRERIEQLRRLIR